MCPAIHFLKMKMIYLLDRILSTVEWVAVDTEGAVKLWEGQTVLAELIVLRTTVASVSGVDEGISIHTSQPILHVVGIVEVEVGIRLEGRSVTVVHGEL